MEELIARSERRIVAAVPPQSPLMAAVDALRARHGVDAGYVRLSGRVRDVVLRCEGAAVPLSLLGPLTLVSGEARVDGNAPVAPRVVLAWSDQGLPRMAAGVLEDAVSEGVEVLVEAWTEAEGAVEAPPAATGSRERAPRPREPAAPPASTPASAAPPTGTGWAAAVAASRAPVPPSASPETPELEADDVELEPGDILVHPRFGRCRVSRVSDDDRVKVRLPTGRLVELHLGVLRLRRCPDEEGRRVFKARIGK